MTSNIFRTIFCVDPSLIYSHDCGKALGCLDEAKKTAYAIPHIFSIEKRRALIEESVKYAQDKGKAEYGEAHRPDCLSDFYVHDALIGQLVKEGPTQHLEEFIDIAYTVATQTVASFFSEERGIKDRASHPSMSNPSYLHAFLLPAAFLAWGTSKKKSLFMFAACILTKSRASVPAFVAGCLAYTFKGLRPPLIAILGLLAAPFIAGSLSRRVFRLFHSDNEARKAHRRVLRAARRDSRVYGYGNYTFAIEDYLEAYLGKGEPHKHVKAERWCDTSHLWFQELKITLGKKGAWQVKKQYFKWIWQSPTPSIAAAMGAHMMCLTFLFRTPSAMVLEDYLIALIEEKRVKGTIINPFHAYYKKREMDFLEREARYKNNAVVYKALLGGNEDNMQKALDLRPSGFYGALNVPRSIGKETFTRFKDSFESFLDKHENPERLFRYWWFLKTFQDPKANLAAMLAEQVSPKRYAYEQKLIHEL